METIGVICIVGSIFGGEGKPCESAKEVAGVNELVMLGIPPEEEEEGATGKMFSFDCLCLSEDLFFSK